MKKPIEDPSRNVFEQCSTRAIRLVVRICPIQSGSLVLVDGRKAWCQKRLLKNGTFGEEENTVGRSPAATLEVEGATEGAGGEKVETKGGTRKFGLPCIWLAAPAIEAEIGGKPTPELPGPMLGTASWTRMSREHPQPCLNFNTRWSLIGCERLFNGRNHRG